MVMPSKSPSDPKGHHKYHVLSDTLRLFIMGKFQTCTSHMHRAGETSMSKTGET
jgi:hypothetical protein